MTDKLRFSPTLKQQTDACVLKTDWANVVQAGLGNTRRVRCYHDANGGIDPVATGIEFLNVGSSGALTIVNGNIVGLGTLSNTTKHIVTDITAGTSTLRIEGNGQWADASLGLPNASTLFHLTENIAADTGTAFSQGAEIKAPAFLNSGTGPLAPLPSDVTIAGFRLCDWSSGSRVVVGTDYFDKQEPNMVMEHPWQAREYGDVLRLRTGDTGLIHWGTGGDSYIVGGDILAGNKVINADADVAYEEVEIRMMPDTGQRWATYPFKGAFDITTDTLVPPAHKIELLDASGNIVDVIEMYSTRDANNTPGSGWPVNDPRLRQNWHGLDTDGTYKPFQSWWNCRMVHAWKSHKPKVHSLLHHFIPGVESDVLNPQNVKARASDMQQYPPITGTSAGNILGAARISPKWSRPKDGGYDTAIVDTVQVLGYSDNYMSQAIGHGFEPGAMGKHTTYNPPGGTRSDRAFWHDTMMSFACDPTGNRVHGNVPWRELIDHWNMNYNNHSHHFWTDVSQGLSIDKGLIKRGDVCFNMTYYGGGNEDYRSPLGTRAIDILAVSAGQGGSDSDYKRDKNGKMFTNQWNRDLMHNQSTPALASYTTVSPRAAINSYHAFSANILANFDATRGVSRMNFTGRAHAWYIGNFVHAWMSVSNHPNSLTAADIEDMFAAHLKLVSDAIRPEWDAQNTVYGVSLKRYGVPLMEHVQTDGTIAYAPEDGADFPDDKAFYFAQVFVTMKQCGLYDKMRARDSVSRWSIDMIMQCLNTHAVGNMYYANGRHSRYSYWRVMVTFPSGGVANMPATWAGLYPPNGQEDFITRDDGAHIWQDNPIDSQNTKHFCAQWLWAMKTYFPELTIPHLDDAITVTNGFYAQVETLGASNSDLYWVYRFKMMGKLKTPDYLGAPV